MVYLSQEAVVAVVVHPMVFFNGNSVRVVTKSVYSRPSLLLVAVCGEFLSFKECDSLIWHTVVNSTHHLFVSHDGHDVHFLAGDELLQLR